VLWHENGPPDVSVGTKARPWHTPGYPDQRETEIAMEQAEALRLLYVACTRARDHLVISLYHKAEREDPGACLAARLLPHAARAAHLSRRLDPPAAQAEPAPSGGIDPALTAAGQDPEDVGVGRAGVMGGAVASPEPLEIGDESRAWDELMVWKAGRADLVSRLGRERAISATALTAAAATVVPGAPAVAAAGDRTFSSAAVVAAMSDGDEVDAGGRGRSRLPAVVNDPSEDELLPWMTARTGSAFGRAVHAVLQSVDLDTGAGIDALAEAQARAEGLGGDGLDVARSAWAALGSAAVRSAISGRWWREVYVATDLGGFIVDGYIDLLYDDVDGLVIVDYKTDAGGDGDLDGVAERYRLQLATYAIAVERTLGRPVVAAELVFARGSGGRQRTVRDLDGAKNEVLSIVAGLRSPT
jgi:hypothetical protein